MIKIFGKYRYHWQPELSWLIIYWSLAVTPIFIAAALLFELYSVPSHILMLFTIFVALFGLGFHRYFIIEDHGILRIVSFNIFRPRKVKISDIEKETELLFPEYSVNLKNKNLPDFRQILYWNFVMKMKRLGNFHKCPTFLGKNECITKKNLFFFPYA